MTYLPKDFNTAYVQQFNLTVQRQIGANVITVGGVGELGRHQPFINIPKPNGPYPNDATQGPSPAPALLTASTLPNVQQIQADAPWATSNYYALQAVFARRFTKGLSLNANYTWAHGLSDAISGSGGGGSTGRIATNPRYDYGNSDVDIRNRFSANWNYKLPWLNFAAFTPQPAGTAGDEQNSALYGPHTRRADMSVFKNFNVTEKISAQFRAEAYNISNTPNFPGPGNSISAWAPGPEHTATTPISKVGLFPGDIPTSAGGFGVISSTTPNVNPRQFQFALKLLF